MAKSFGRHAAEKKRARSRILIVEDDEAVRRFLRQALENAGYKVIAGRDGQEGISLYRESPTDLIITDIVMPGKDGLAVIMEIRTEFPESRLIAISGGNDQATDEMLQMADKFGAFRTLQKPFSVSVLLEAVREALESKNNDDD